MSDRFREAISYHTGVDLIDRPPIFNNHNNSPRTSSILCNVEAKDNGVISQEQIQLTNISYRRGERRITLKDSETSSDRRKFIDCSTPRDNYSIRCIFRSLESLFVRVTKRLDIGSFRKEKNT